MLSKEYIFETAQQAREDLERGNVDRERLVMLYFSYARIPITFSFVRQALLRFPEGNCGLASVYLKDIFNTGTPKHGKFDGFGHTALLGVGEVELVDITADQFGG